MDIKELQRRQTLSLQDKINLSIERIKEWYEYWEGKVYVSFSGGKDSTVLLHLVRSIYPDVKGVFVNTGLEFPEIKSFVRSLNNIVELHPKMKFWDVINKYGYPVISKENAEKIHQIRTAKSQKTINTRLNGDSKGNGKLPEKWKFMINAPFKISSNCCNIMKKNPVKKYEKETGNRPYVGTMTTDSRLRQTNYIKYGCNNFLSKRGMSLPLSFWNEQDIWNYIKLNNIPYSKIYDMGYDRTGCMFCMFGIHMEKDENRFIRMSKTHPKQYKYCIEKLGCGKVLDYMNVPYKYNFF
jgi:3'-phosphoadenosine 5'-phosphosulfate sulfotransferase (PAPS reductase)/FAD synthetase